MSTVSDGNTFYVFKFASTGIEALLDETLDALREGLDERYGFDRDTMRFERREGEIRFVFDMLPLVQTGDVFEDGEGCPKFEEDESDG